MLSSNLLNSVTVESHIVTYIFSNTVPGPHPASLSMGTGGGGGDIRSLLMFLTFI